MPPSGGTSILAPRTTVTFKFLLQSSPSVVESDEEGSPWQQIPVSLSQHHNVIISFKPNINSVLVISDGHPNFQTLRVGFLPSLWTSDTAPVLWSTTPGDMHHENTATGRLCDHHFSVFLLLDHDCHESHVCAGLSDVKVLITFKCDSRCEPCLAQPLCL